MTTEQRLARLERRNKVLVGWSLILSVLLAAVSWRALTREITPPDRLPMLDKVTTPEGERTALAADFAIFEQIQVKRIYMADVERGVIMLEMDEHGPTVSLHGADRGHIELRVWNGLPTIHVKDERGNTATLGCADTRSRDAGVEPNRPASSLYLQDRLRRVIWKAPKD